MAVLKVLFSLILFKLRKSKSFPFLKDVGVIVVLHYGLIIYELRINHLPVLGFGFGFGFEEFYPSVVGSFLENWCFQHPLIS